MNNTNWKKNTTLFLSSQTISLLGSSIVQYAITWYITLETKSGFMMAVSIICGFLPTLFISPFAGVWADRYPRKLIIMLSDSLIAISTLLLAIIFLIGNGSIWLLFVASAIRSFGSGIQAPAVGAFLPQLVPEDKLNRVNGINASIQSLVTLVSPILSGALLGVVSIDLIFFIDVITAAVAVLILLLFLRVPHHVKARKKEKISYIEDMVEGLSFIRNHSFVKTFFLFCACFFVLASPFAFLTPLQVTRTFGDEVWRLSIIEITFSAGMMVGGIVIASWGGFKNRLYTMVLSVLIIALGSVGLGVIPNFWIYSSIMGVVGFVMPMFNTPLMVLIQEKVDDEFMGRVFGVFSMISSSVLPLAMLLYGPLADLIPIEWMLIVTGVLMFILGIFLSRNKVLKEAGKQIG